MRRVVLVELFAAWLSVPLLAQLQPMPMGGPGQPRPEAKPVPVQQKLRYIVKQLGLNESQSQHAEGLFAILEAEVKPDSNTMKERLERIRAVYQEMAEAKDRGDAERTRQLKEELEGLSPGKAAEKNFVEGLNPVLTEEQRAKFERLLKQLEGTTDLSLKPIQVVRLAREQKLTPEQRRKLDELEQSFRKSVVEAGEPDALHRADLVDKLIADIGALLSPQQRTQFEKEIEKLRPEPAAPRPATPAETPPTTQPAKKP